MCYFLDVFNIMQYIKIATRGKSMPKSMPAFKPSCSAVMEHFDAKYIDFGLDEIKSVIIPTN
jgi:hypothetical protein